MLVHLNILPIINYFLMHKENKKGCIHIRALQLLVENLKKLLNTVPSVAMIIILKYKNSKQQ